MTAADHQRLVARYIEEVWDKRNPAAADAFLAPQYRRHLSPTAAALTPDEQKARLRAFQAAFPDVQVTVEEIITEGDGVVFRAIMRGTHQGALFGIPPTGKRVTVALLDMIRVENGRFVEHWGGPDMFDLLRQLGASISPPEDEG